MLAAAAEVAVTPILLREVMRNMAAAAALTAEIQVGEQLCLVPQFMVVAAAARAAE